MVEETKCNSCGEDLESLPFVCKFCSHSFCTKHQLPENHNCEGLDKWKRGELKKFKKPIGPPKQKPFDLDRMTEIIMSRGKTVKWYHVVIILIFLLLIGIGIYLRSQQIFG